MQGNNPASITITCCGLRGKETLIWNALTVVVHTVIFQQMLYYEEKNLESNKCISSPAADGREYSIWDGM